MLYYPYFELISKYSDTSLLPTRATSDSAGYDFVVAEDIVLKPYREMFLDIKEISNMPMSLQEVADITKKYNCKPTLVPTGVKAYIPKGYYLQLSVRSSCPLKDWLILANGVGVVDGDYYNNPNNEGHIFFQIINLFPQHIILHKGDKIGQGIFLPYATIKNDAVTDSRTGGFGSTSK